MQEPELCIVGNLPEEPVVRILGLHASLRTQTQVQLRPIRWPAEVECSRIQEPMDLAHLLFVYNTVT